MLWLTSIRFVGVKGRHQSDTQSEIRHIILPMDYKIRRNETFFFSSAPCKTVHGASTEHRGEIPFDWGLCEPATPDVVVGLL